MWTARNTWSFCCLFQPQNFGFGTYIHAHINEATTEGTVPQECSNKVFVDHKEHILLSSTSKTQLSLHTKLQTAADIWQSATLITQRFQDPTCKPSLAVAPSFVVQKGLIRSPEPKGEKGSTFAHITASLIEMADCPSSRKYTGP